MALMRGRLFAGALFAGALFGAGEIAVVVPEVQASTDLPFHVQRITTLAKKALSPRGATYRPGGFARLGWREPKP